MTIDKLITFRNSNGCIFVDPDDIGYVKADINYSHIFFMDGRRETVSMNLGNVNSELTDRNFIRIDRSHIINANYLFKVDSIKHHCVLLKSGSELILSPSVCGLKVLRGKSWLISRITS